MLRPCRKLLPPLAVLVCGAALLLSLDGTQPFVAAIPVPLAVAGVALAIGLWIWLTVAAAHAAADLFDARRGEPPTASQADKDRAG